MLYPKSKSEKLDEKLFENPTKEYRGAPFWSWNCHVTKELIQKQVPIFKEMGMGGFHVHPRIGFDTPYMSEEYFDLLRECCEQAEKNDLLCWLYDEDGFPSGNAGGLATKEIRFRARHLLLTREIRNEYCKNRQEFDQAASDREKCGAVVSGSQAASDREKCPVAVLESQAERQKAPQSEKCFASETESQAAGQTVSVGKEPKGYYVCSYRICLKDGCLESYERLSSPVSGKKTEGNTSETFWNAYLVLSPNKGTANEPYLDTMSPAAVRKFIDVTHENYDRELGDRFSKTIPAIFTDEPHITDRYLIPYGEYEGEAALAYTDDFSETFEKAYGKPFLDVLPEALWELPEGKMSFWRYAYNDHLTERFAEAYGDQIGRWCKEHKLNSTGHLLSERTMFQQTYRLGEAMRHYRGFQIPGIDILCGDHEFSTAKQAVSVARQYGREGVISELYGVTQWYQDFKGHKLQGDWQAALGVTVRVPHLAWMTMEGIGKRDWPASIFYQSPWYRKYPFIEDHFARLNTVLTRGKALVKVAVIHPIESFWLKFGTNEATKEDRDLMDEQFESLIRWLIYGTIDFDFISESLLPEEHGADGCPLTVGEMTYDAVLVPDLLTIRSTTLSLLEKFAKAGGKVVFAGKVPKLLDAKESELPEKFAASCQQVPFNRVDVLKALETERLVEVKDQRGSHSTQIITQLREDGNDWWLFCCHTGEVRKAGLAETPEKYTICVKGIWNPVLYDTFTGKHFPIPAEEKEGRTCIYREMYAEDSLLLKLERKAPVLAAEKRENGNFQVVEVIGKKTQRTKKVEEPFAFVLSEPNCILLDCAACRREGEDFGEKTYLLELTSKLRGAFGYADEENPWKIADAPAKEVITLRYEIASETDTKPVWLAAEHPEAMSFVRLNGSDADLKTDCGWFTDHCIRKILLNGLKTGKNILEIGIPFGPKTLLEPCYLLGNFGVRVAGSRITVEKAPKELVFGDVCTQGLPFYTGNITYACRISIQKGERAVLQVPHFESPVLEVSVEGKEERLLAFSPHCLDLGELTEGEHVLKITAYGNRYNCFGTLHNADPEYKWYGPAAYRTFDGQWTDSYLLRPNGILSAPKILLL